MTEHATIAFGRLIHHSIGRCALAHATRAVECVLAHRPVKPSITAAWSARLNVASAHEPHSAGANRAWTT